MLIIDIGCGRKKIIGSVGLDFSDMSDADIRIDLNSESFPFDDCSVDYAYASHSLEHLTVTGFLHVMDETYRCLKPNGQFKIIAPYFQGLLNFANIFHNNSICFNEHTFRFFSSEIDTNSLEYTEYADLSCPHWGLRYSANCEINIEFRTLAVDFFYFEKFMHKSKKEKNNLRNSQLNVVSQICYTLEAVKPCPVRPETGPVGTKDCPKDLIAKQLEVIRVLLNSAKKYNLVDENTIKAHNFINNLQWNNHIYKVDNIFSPSSFLVLELDYLIHAIKKAINNYESERRSGKFMATLKDRIKYFYGKKN